MSRQTTLSNVKPDAFEQKWAPTFRLERFKRDMNILYHEFKEAQRRLEEKIGGKAPSIQELSALADERVAEIMEQDKLLDAGHALLDKWSETFNDVKQKQQQRRKTVADHLILLWPQIETRLAVVAATLETKNTYSLEVAWDRVNELKKQNEELKIEAAKHTGGQLASEDLRKLLEAARPSFDMEKYQEEVVSVQLKARTAEAQLEVANKEQERLTKKLADEAKSLARAGKDLKKAQDKHDKLQFEKDDHVQHIKELLEAKKELLGRLRLLEVDSAELHELNEIMPDLDPQSLREMLRRLEDLRVVEDLMPRVTVHLGDYTYDGLSAAIECLIVRLCSFEENNKTLQDILSGVRDLAHGYDSDAVTILSVQEPRLYGLIEGLQEMAENVYGLQSDIARVNQQYTGLSDRIIGLPSEAARNFGKLDQSTAHLDDRVQMLLDKAQKVSELQGRYDGLRDIINEAASEEARLFSQLDDESYHLAKRVTESQKDGDKVPGLEKSLLDARIRLKGLTDLILEVESEHAEAFPDYDPDCSRLTTQIKDKAAHLKLLMDHYVGLKDLILGNATPASQSFPFLSQDSISLFRVVDDMRLTKERVSAMETSFAVKNNTIALMSRTIQELQDQLVEIPRLKDQVTGLQPYKENEPALKFQAEKVPGLERLLQDSRKEFQEKIREKNADLTTETNKVTDLEWRIDSLQTAVYNSKSMIQHKDDELKVEIAKVNALQDKLKISRDNISTLEAGNKNLQDEVDAKEADMQRQVQEVSSLRQDLKTSTSTTTILQVQVKDLQGKLSSTHERISTLNDEVDRLKPFEDELSTAREACQKKQEDLDRQIGSLVDEEKKLRRQHAVEQDVLRKEKSALEQSTSALEKTNSTISQEKANVEQNLVTVQNDLAKLKFATSNYEDVKKDRDQLIEQKNELINTNAKLIEDAKSEKEGLEQANTTIQDELNTARVNHTSLQASYTSLQVNLDAFKRDHEVSTAKCEELTVNLGKERQSAKNATLQLKIAQDKIKDLEMAASTRAANAEHTINQLIKDKNDAVQDADSWRAKALQPRSDPMVPMLQTRLAEMITPEVHQQVQNEKTDLEQKLQDLRDELDALKVANLVDHETATMQRDQLTSDKIELTTANTQLTTANMQLQNDLESFRSDNVRLQDAAKGLDVERREKLALRADLDKSETECLRLHRDLAEMRTKVGTPQTPANMAQQPRRRAEERPSRASLPSAVASGTPAVAGSDISTEVRTRRISGTALAGRLVQSYTPARTSLPGSSRIPTLAGPIAGQSTTGQRVGGESSTRTAPTQPSTIAGPSTVASSISKQYRFLVTGSINDGDLTDDVDPALVAMMDAQIVKWEADKDATDWKKHGKPAEQRCVAVRRAHMSRVQGPIGGTEDERTACKKCIKDKELCVLVSSAGPIVAPLPSRQRGHARPGEVAYYVKL